MYGSGMLPGPAVASALDLNVVAAWGGSLVKYGSWDILILFWGEEQYLLALAELLLLFGIVGVIEVLLLTLLLCQQEVANLLHIDGGSRLTRALEGPVV